ncbi:MAG: hypothetical protein ACI81A_000566, partial [Paraglaciecola sp.]
EIRPFLVKLNLAMSTETLVIGQAITFWSDTRHEEFCCIKKVVGHFFDHPFSFFQGIVLNDHG